MTAALDAIARLDYGTPRPGDTELAEVFDRHCRWGQDRYEHALHERLLADWNEQYGDDDEPAELAA